MPILGKLIDPDRERFPTIAPGASLAYLQFAATGELGSQATVMIGLGWPKLTQVAGVTEWPLGFFRQSRDTHDER